MGFITHLPTMQKDLKNFPSPYHKTNTPPPFLAAPISRKNPIHPNYSQLQGEGVGDSDYFLSIVKLAPTSSLSL